MLTRTSHNCPIVFAPGNSRDSASSNVDRCVGVRLTKHSSQLCVVGGVPVSGGCVVVDRCSSIVGFAVWEVIGAEAEPDSSCCDTVPPQLPTPTALSISSFESNIGFKQSLLTDAA